MSYLGWVCPHADLNSRGSRGLTQGMCLAGQDLTLRWDPDSAQLAGFEVLGLTAGWLM